MMKNTTQLPEREDAQSLDITPNTSKQTNFTQYLTNITLLQILHKKCSAKICIYWPSSIYFIIGLNMNAWILKDWFHGIEMTHIHTSS